jgi:hypothetical protein
VAVPTRFVSFDAAEQIRIDEKAFDSFVFFGDRVTDGGGPQMYMNRVDEGTQLAAHFHRVDQFQVFFGSRDSVFQRKPIAELVVHYTDAYSTYGPFNSGELEPLLYATIRAESSNFGGVMPGARHLRPYRGNRQLSVDVENWGVANLPAAAEFDIRKLFDAQPDGLGALLIRLGPNATVDLSQEVPTSGRALCVVSGEIRFGEQTFGARSLGWNPADGGPINLVAGPQGAAVLAMDFPYPATQTARATDSAAASPAST